jgi:phospholipid transport system substrate-binding protein
MDPRDESTQLDYKMEKTDSGWLIYDVDIDNMSLIRIYNSNFSNELLHGGVPNLVSVLHKKNQEVEAARHG